MKNHLKKQHIHVTNTMPRVITPIHKLLKKKKKNKKITSILNKAGSMVTTRLQASRKNIQQQQHHQAPQTKSAATPKRKGKTPYDSTAKMQEIERTRNSDSPRIFSASCGKYIQMKGIDRITNL